MTFDEKIILLIENLEAAASDLNAKADPSGITIAELIADVREYLAMTAMPIEQQDAILAEWEAYQGDNRIEAEVIARYEIESIKWHDRSRQWEEAYRTVLGSFKGIPVRQLLTCVQRAEQVAGVDEVYLAAWNWLAPYFPNVPIEGSNG